MNTDELSREIERANRKMVELRRAARGEGASSWSEAALAELSCAVEELKVAEEELIAQNADLADAHAESEYARHRFRELFMAAPFGQLVTDLKGRITEANRAAGDLLGTPARSLAGKGLIASIAEGDRDRFARWLGVLAEASHDASVCCDCGGTGEFQLVAAGRVAPWAVEITAAPLADRAGRIESIRWCIRDLSDREKARNAERLAEESRRKDEFLAVVGHELRNPLSAITLAADILTANGRDAARNRWAAEVVKRHAEQLRRLVEDLLDVSRVSQGKISLQPETIDLRDVVASAVDSCQPLLQGKGHQVSVSRPDGRLEVRGDPVRLRQVIANLIDNACKYTPSGGRIEIAVRKDDGCAVIEVQDSGIGIAPPMLELIFGPYEQVAGAAELRERGLGLGLALVRQLVSLHGGRVWAASDGEGRGSTFTVALPALADEAAAGTERSEEGGVRAMTDGHRILIVDDNADAAELMADKLRQSGWRVELAFDGRSGLAAARGVACQLALVDLGLPDLDGFEVCRTLKGEQPELCVVALTGYSDPRSRERAREVGFDRFLVKPLELRQVMAVLEELLGPREP